MNGSLPCLAESLRSFLDNYKSEERKAENRKRKEEGGRRKEERAKSKKERGKRKLKKVLCVAKRCFVF